MRSGCRTRWNAPTPAVEQERRLGLRTRKAELSGIGLQPPRRPILPQAVEAFGNIGIRHPNDTFPIVSQNGVHTLGSHQLDGPGAILTDDGEHGERIIGRNLEPDSPMAQDRPAIGQQVLHPRLDLRVLMRGLAQGHL